MAGRGRPDESGVRKDQILDAAVRCIADKGLRAASLEAIAKEAGMTRGNVRHYLGNREDLILALIDRINERDRQTNARITAIDSRSERLHALSEYLFGPGFASTELENQVILDLVLAARTDPSIRSALSGGYLHIVSSIQSAVSGEKSDEARAYVLLALAMGSAILRELDLPEELSDAVRAQSDELLS